MLAIVVDDQHNKLLSSSPGEKLICDISAAALYCYSLRSCDGPGEGHSAEVVRQHLGIKQNIVCSESR